jgi:hypothetical protein
VVSIDALRVPEPGAAGLLALGLALRLARARRYAGEV